MTILDKLIAWTKGSSTRRYALIALVVVLALGSAYAAGRYSAPVKEVEKEKVVYQEKLVYQDKEVVKWKTKTVFVDTWDKHKTCTEDFDPATGNLLKRVCTTDSSGSHQGGSDSDGSSERIVYVDREVVKVVEKEKLVLREGHSNWEVSLGAALTLVETDLTSWSFDLPEPTLTLSVDRRLLGPLWLGVWASSDWKLTSFSAGAAATLALP